MASFIEPKTLKGFRDFLPEDEILRASLSEKLTCVFRSHGFLPIDTPVLEYSEILLRKSDGETEKQMFRFSDNGGRDVGLRFDLTVPFARFTAQHKDKLTFPFKRYQIAKVWRGEKPQAGRYREFVQCDFDTIGADCAAADFETLLVAHSALKAIAVANVTLRVNHRGIFNRFLERLSLRGQSEAILRTVDKIAKVGKDKVLTDLDGITGSEEAAQQIADFITPLDDSEGTLSKMEELSGAVEECKRLRSVLSLLKECGIESGVVVDPSVTRGLDYYTGVVFETFLDELPSIGSVCSGGRYDDLAGLYTKEKISGVGASIGLDRLIAALAELKGEGKAQGYIDAEVFCSSCDTQEEAERQRLACLLRQRGLGVDVYPDCAKMSKQYALAESKGVPWGIFCKADDAGGVTFALKNLKTRESMEGFSPSSAEKIAQIIKGEV